MSDERGKIMPPSSLRGCLS